MCTLIELFDNADPVENIAAGLMVAAERIIYIGSNQSLFDKHLPRYERLYKSRGLDVRIGFKLLPKSAVDDIAEVLCDIFCDFPDAVIDAVGGEDHALIAAGAALERYKQRDIPMFRINLLTGEFTAIHGELPPLRENPSHTLTVEENMLIHGGTVSYAGGYEYRRTPSSDKDLERMWALCAEHSKGWSRACSTLECFVRNADEKNSVFRMSRGEYENMLVTLPGSVLKKRTGMEKMLGKFYKEGLLTKCILSGDEIVISFKNEFVRYCLTRIGVVMELKTFTCCEDMQRGGKNFFDDVKTGVTIRWDDDEETPDDIDSVNEIDVIAMRGFYSIFISCKSGNVTEEEPYKLAAVAERFGGCFGRKMLFTLSRNTPAFRERCADLRIKLAECCATDDDIELRFKSVL